MKVNDSCYEHVYHEKRTWDGMKAETDRGISLYVRDDSGVESCEKRYGYFVLNNALIF